MLRSLVWMVILVSVLRTFAYSSDDPNGTTLGEVTTGIERSIGLEANGVGNGSITIHPDDTAAAYLAQGNFVRAWLTDTMSSAITGDPVGGFWVETGGDIVLSENEDGGLAYKRQGRGPIAILEEAIVWHRAVSGGDGQVQPRRGRWKWKNAHPARCFVRLLEEAQARGGLDGVTWDFTRTHDSDGNAWDTSEYADRFTFNIGRNLLEVAADLREAGLYVDMDASLVIHAYEEDAYGTDRSASITLAAGTNITETSEREMRALAGKSVVLVGGENRSGVLRYRATRDATHEATLGRRKEAFYPFPRTANKTILRKVGQRKLNRWMKQWEGPLTLGILGVSGATPAVDFNVGDTVEIDVPDIYDEVAENVAGIMLVEKEHGEVDYIVDFGDQAHDPITGAYLGGDREGINPCGCGSTGAYGSGDDSGDSASTGGTSLPTPINTVDYILDDFERGYDVDDVWGDPSIVTTKPPFVGATTTRTGTPSRLHAQSLSYSPGAAGTMDLPLPDYIDRAGVTIYGWLKQTSSETDRVDEWLRDTHGWTIEDEQVVNSTFRVSHMSYVVDGTEGFDRKDSELAFVHAAGISGFQSSLFAFEGVADIYLSKAAGVDPPSVDVGSTLPGYWFASVYDTATPTGSPTGYTVQSSDSDHLSYVKADVTAQTEDPSTYTAGSGGSPYAFTIGLVGAATESPIALPDGSNGIGRTVVLFIAHGDYGGDPIPEVLADTGVWTALGTDQDEGDVIGGVVYRIIDGSEDWTATGQTIAVGATLGVPLVVHAVLLDGVRVVDGVSDSTNGNPSLDMSGDGVGASDEVLWMAFTIDDDDQPYHLSDADWQQEDNHVWDGGMGLVWMHVDAVALTGDTENPPSWSGGLASWTIGLAAKDSYESGNVGQFSWGHIPTPDVTGAWWLGSVRWCVLDFGMGAITMDGDGTVTIRGDAPNDWAMFALTSSDDPLSQSYMNVADGDLLPQYLRDDFVMETDFEIDRLGDSGTGTRYIDWAMTIDEREVEVQMRLGDGTYDAGTIALNGTTTETSEVALTAAAKWTLALWWSSTDGKVYAKAWLASGSEPDWDDATAVSLDMEPDPGGNDSIALRARLGDSTGSQTVTLHDIRVRAAVGSGDIVRMAIGTGDGTTTTFPVGMPFDPDTMQVLAAGVAQLVASMDEAAYTVTLAAAPASGTIEAIFERD